MLNIDFSGSGTHAPVLLKIPSTEDILEKPFLAQPCGPKVVPGKAHWFADLEFSRRGLFVRKTGRRIGLNEIAPTEFFKFCSYLTVVLIKSAWIRVFKPSEMSVHFTPDRPRPWYVVWSAMAVASHHVV